MLGWEYQICVKYWFRSSIIITLANQDYYLLILIDSLMYEIKTEDVLKILIRIKEYLILVIIKLSQYITMIQRNQLLVR